MPSCAALFCSNRKSLKIFPKDVERRKQWEEIVNKHGLKGLNYKPDQCAYLCENHFSEKQYEKVRRDGQRKLKNTAIPDIFWDSKLLETDPELLDSGPEEKSVNEKLPEKPCEKTIMKEHSYFNKVEKFPGEPKPSKDETENVSSVSEIVCDNQQGECSEPSVKVFDEIEKRGEMHCDLENECVPKINYNDVLSLEDQYVANNEVVGGVNVKLFKNKNIIIGNNEDASKTVEKLQKQVNQLQFKLKKTKNELTNVKINAYKNDSLKILRSIFQPDQIDHLRKKKDNHGKIVKTKWNEATLKKALQLRFACGKSGYQELIKVGLPYPSTRTLQRSMENVVFESGILEVIFEFLKVKVTLFKNPKEGDCCLVLDEMSIKPKIEFDNGKHCKTRIGYVTLPREKIRATKALVFILAGLNSRWKQTVAYYFTGSTVSGEQLSGVINEIVIKAETIKLMVHIVTSDMGPCNQGMWRAFGIHVGKNVKFSDTCKHPADENRNLFFLPDVPHLLKNLKNSLISNKKFFLPNTICIENNLPQTPVNIEHVKKLVELEQDNQLKMAYKLKMEDLSAGSHFNKMSVAKARQFFSREVSAGLNYLAETSGDAEIYVTSWFIETVCVWFTLMTSRSRVVALSLKNIEEFTKAIIFFEDFIDLFGAWKPVQTGIVMATKTMIDIAHYLLYDRGYDFFLTGRTTSDCVENLFSCVRAPQPVPTALQFKYSLRTQTVSQYLKYVTKGSYDEDDSEYLVDFFSKRTSNQLAAAFAEKKASLQLPASYKEHSYEINLQEKKVLYHCIGYIIFKLERFISCKDCIGAVVLDRPPDMDYASFTLNKDIKNSLIKVTDSFFFFIHECEMIFRWLQPSLENQAVQGKGNFVNEMKEILKKELADKFSGIFSDCHNFFDRVITYFCVFRLKNWSSQLDQKRKNEKRNEEKDGKENTGIDLSSKSVAMRQLAQQIGRKRKQNVLTNSNKENKKMKISTERTKTKICNVSPKKILQISNKENIYFTTNAGKLKMK